MIRPRVAVVGGGFSGAAVAYHLASAGVGADILLFEPRARLGAGLAYGGDDPVHRINVPAARMSLLPRDDAHFTRWLSQTGALARDDGAIVRGEAFPRRSEFGRYVDASVRPFVDSGAIRHVPERVVSMSKAGGWRLVVESGRAFEADIAVIATTHPAARVPRELASLRHDPGLILDPLAAGALERVERDETVLIIGSGLTAADLVAGLYARGHPGSITMVSRRGLRSRGHARAPFPPEGEFVSPPARTATALLARVRAAMARAEAEGRTWHSVIEGLRQQSGAIWSGLTLDGRRRLVRHLRPYWDVHRFRVAPQIEAVLDAKLADGSLRLRRARLGAVARNGDRLAVELRDLRLAAATTEDFDRIVLATGPSHGDVLRTQPFGRELAEAGALTLDPTGLGLDVNLESNALDVGGEADPTLFVAGPLARGAFGELMGLPQVALHAQFVADRVAKALASNARMRLGPELTKFAPPLGGRNDR